METIHKVKNIVSKYLHFLLQMCAGACNIVLRLHDELLPMPIGTYAILYNEIHCINVYDRVHGQRRSLYIREGCELPFLLPRICIEQNIRARISKIFFHRTN